jgi:hypothetical protein
MAPARIFDFPVNLCKFMASPYPQSKISTSWLIEASFVLPL